MVAEESLRGVTANPSIFEKAILGSDDYDDELREMAQQELSAAGDLRPDRDPRRPARGRRAARGVRRVARRPTATCRWRWRPTWRTTPSARIEAARHYWQALSRQNTMIKIPGTPEGTQAIEQALYEGINVNVTLLFAVEAYEAVAEAYLRALERRHADGLPLDVHSVASFFVSRVDTNIDRKLEELGRTDLAGRAGAGQRPRRLPPLPGDLLRPAVGGAAPRRARRCSVRCGPRPASRTPTTPTRCTSTGWSGATPSTRCRWRRCTPSPTTPTSAGRPPSRTRRRTSRRSREAGIDLRRR